MKTLFFDLDDTLLPTQELYNQTKEEVASYISKLTKIEIKEIMDLFEAIDLKNAKTLGLSKHRFPKSWMDTYSQLSDVKDEKEIKVVKTMAEKVFTTELKPFKEAKQMLSDLRQQGFEMYILTSGEQDVQERRIKQSGLSLYFDGFYIIPLKNTATMQSIIKEPINSVMIGNSLKSDIEPALSIGMTAVHIERVTWGFDKAQVDKTDRNYYQSSLEFLPEVIKNIQDSTFVIA